MKFKEEPADLAVKARLWDATERELETFAGKYAAGFVKGDPYSDDQRNVAWAAKLRGYRIGLVRKLGDFTRRGEWGGEDALELRSAYRRELGL